METKKAFKILTAIALGLLLFGSAAAAGLPITTLEIGPASGSANADTITVKDNSGNTLADTNSTPEFANYTIKPGTYYITVAKTGYSTYSETRVAPDGAITPTPIIVSYNLVKIAPLAPSNLTATLLTATSVQLMWKDNSADEEHYIIYRNNQELETIAPNSVSYVDRNVVDGSTYTYSVRAFDDDSTSFTDSNTATITIMTQLSKPVLTASAISPTEVKLTWADLPNEDSYRLEKKDSTGNFVTLTSPVKNTVTYTDTVALQSTNTYRLTAINSFNPTGVTSDEVTATAPDNGLVITATIESVDAGESADITVKVTNWLGYDMKNLEGTVTIADLDIDESIDIGSVAKGATKSETITVDIPSGIDEDNYDVATDLAWEDSANENYDDSFDLGTINVDVPSHSVQLTDVFLTTTKVGAGDTIKVLLTVNNNGNSKENVVVRLVNAELGVESLNFEVPKGESVPAVITLEVPEDADSGNYPLTVSVAYSSKTVTATDKPIVSVTGVAKAPSTAAIVDTTGTDKGTADQVPLWLIALLIGLGVILAVEVALKAQSGRSRDIEMAQSY